MLMAENARSVGHRYCYKADVEPYVCGFPLYYAPTKRPNVVESLKVISCLEYQCCEPDDWDGTETFKVLAQLRQRLDQCIPGWEDARGWEWRERVR